MQPTRNQYPASCSVCQVRFEGGRGWLQTDNLTKTRKFYCNTHKPKELTYNIPDYDDDSDPAPIPQSAKREPMQAPETTEPAFDVDDLLAQIAKLSAAYATSRVPELVQEALLKLAPRQLEIKVGKAPKVTLDTAHHCLPVVLAAVMAGANPFLVGPAGSGKTTLAEQVAHILKRKFYMAARVTSEYKLTGFIDAQGNCVRTQFREAYETGGVFLFDEVDASDPDAMTTFNAALANGIADFPDGMVKRHPDFVAVAAGNTFGRGADRQYVGRNQLDAATLDRFQVFEIDYDENLEMKLAGDAEWCVYVQRVRRAIVAETVRHIVSPRASIMGAKLLSVGMERSVVEEACIWKGLPKETRQRVEYRMASLG